MDYDFNTNLARDRKLAYDLAPSLETAKSGNLAKDQAGNLTFRPMNERDVRHVFGILNDNDIADHMNNIPAPFRMIDAKAFCDDNIATKSQRDRLCWIIQDDNDPIGLIAGKRASGTFPSFWLNVAIIQSYHGQGIATSVLHGYLREIFTAYGVQAAFIEVAEDNHAGLNLFNKFDFKPFGSEIVRSKITGQDQRQILFRLDAKDFMIDEA